MSEKNINVKIIQAFHTTEELSKEPLVNKVIDKGLVVYEECDNNIVKVKIGDGVNVWKDLKYINSFEINDDVISDTSTYSSNKLEDLMSTLGGSSNSNINDEMISTLSTYSSNKINSLITGIKYDVSSHESDINNPHKVTKEQLGLTNVDNTSDMNKPISTAQQAAIDNMVDKIDTHTTNKENPHNITKDQIGLDNVDNTSDVNKPISIATQDALDEINTNVSDLSTSINNHAFNKENPHGVTKVQVGLENVDNTSDMSKPVSTATQTAIDETLSTSKSYTDAKIANLIGSAPETLNTLEEIAHAIEDNKDVVDTLNSAIGTKASQSDLNTLQTTVNNKANQSDLSTLQNTVNTKANQSELQSLQTTVGTKASQSDLNTHTSNKSNPHGITSTQVGLGNVPNVTTNDQTPTYTIASSNTALSSGEKLSIAFGKIAKAVNSLISHLSNTSNPHSVTKSQVGLGNVNNTSDVNKPISSAMQTALNNKSDKTHVHSADTLTFDNSVSGMNSGYIQSAIDELKNSIGSSSKNLIPYPYSASTLENGITFLDLGDGRIKANGSNPNGASSYYLITNFKPNFNNSKVKLSIKSTSGKASVFFRLWGTGGTYIEKYDFNITQKNGEITINMPNKDDYSYASVELFYYQNNTVSNDIVEIMIRSASIEDDSYVSYVPDVKTQIDNRFSHNIPNLTFPFTAPHGGILTFCVASGMPNESLCGVQVCVQYPNGEMRFHHCKGYCDGWGAISFTIPLGKGDTVSPIDGTYSGQYNGVLQDRCYFTY